MSHWIPRIVYGGFVPTVIDFDYPPVGFGPEEQFDVKENVSESLSGIRQVSVNSIEALFKPTFSHLSPTLKAQLQTFFLSHAGLGKSFKYYEDKDGVDYKVYELKDLKFSPKRMGIRGENLFGYEIPFSMRRVQDIEETGDFLEDSILNNQATPVNISSLILDASKYRSVKLFCDIRRKTDSNFVLVNGYLTATYKDDGTGWEITEKGTFDGGDHGLTFSINSIGGQVAYISDNMAGSNYEGDILLKQFTITGV